MDKYRTFREGTKATFRKYLIKKIGVKSSKHTNQKGDLGKFFKVSRRERARAAME